MAGETLNDLKEQLREAHPGEDFVISTPDDAAAVRIIRDMLAYRALYAKPYIHHVGGRSWWMARPKDDPEHHVVRVVEEAEGFPTDHPDGACFACSGAEPPATEVVAQSPERSGLRGAR